MLPKLTGKVTPTTNDIGIDIPGFLKNMLNEGFSTLHCLSELIDDSQGANASAIKVSLDDAFVLSDTGDSMTRDKLVSAHCFHSRSSVSKKHGRFGIGRKHALVHFTNLKGSAVTVCNTGTLSQLTINFPEICATGRITLHSHGIEEETRPLWDKYAIDPKGKGTMTYIYIDKDILAKLKAMAKSNQLQQNLSYYLGTTYNKYLTTGEITIHIDGTSLKVYPIDRLCWDRIQGDKKTITLDIYYNPEDKNDIRAYFTQSLLKTNSGKYGYFKEGKGNFIREDAPKEYKLLGKTVIRCAYSNDWVKLQEGELTRIGIKIPAPKEDGRQPFEWHLGGTELERNEKVIAVFPPVKATSGDTGKYKYVENSRYSVSFTPVSPDEYTLDDIYNVQINKSRVDEAQINTTVWKTIRKIQDNFATNCYQRNEPQEAPKVTSATVTTPAHTPLPITKKQVAPQPAAAQPAATPQPAAAPQSAPQPQQKQTVTEVSSHTRLGSKSERDIILQIFEMVSTLSTIDKNAMIQKVNNTSETGLTEVYRRLLEADKILKKYT
jgi:hypothetical protein